MKLVPRARPAAREAAVAAGSTATGDLTEATGAAEASRADDSLTRITAIAPASRANHAGSTCVLLPDIRQLVWCAKFKEI
jgi:hypothetical protein